MSLSIIPITFRAASDFVRNNHRHNKPPTGHKFSIGLSKDGSVCGVIMVGRPVSRMLDDGVTCEVNRSCTDGSKNANSMLYGAAWRAAKAMGYLRCITYTQADECGSSLRAAGWVMVKRLPARKSWAESSGPNCSVARDPVGNGGIERVLWEIKSA